MCFIDEILYIMIKKMLSISKHNQISNPSGYIPYDLDIFYRGEEYFLPDGKDFEDLTFEERKKIQSQYRFSPLRPGIYQGITGISDKSGNIC